MVGGGGVGGGGCHCVIRRGHNIGCGEGAVIEI